MNFKIVETASFARFRCETSLLGVSALLFEHRLHYEICQDDPCDNARSFACTSDLFVFWSDLQIVAFLASPLP